ncbi:Pkinase-domain-containing protein [Pseudovirgaria hyperparasitica]|uniref:Pkinase-domain-containing protein n=1 Tax=Pseudovirgaria hyperparasitica TaxID=470096 RepID=A0A6A6WCV7_9PEZI|nr:Pkinase-domain-containing protein [Pseudovirgaria hyperparasitica]KAF2759407.1 Pkinase-domain-containing protein [Pseudovirgaria hyperparasitica]
MPPLQEQGSKLKRGLDTVGESDSKKPRRSNRISSQGTAPDTPLKKGLEAVHLPSPLTHKDSTATEDYQDGTVTPISDKSQFGFGKKTGSSPRNARNGAGLSSPPQDTQPFSQFILPPHAHTFEVEDEEAEGVWGYLIPVDSKNRSVLVMKARSACPVSKDRFSSKKTGKEHVNKKTYEDEENAYEAQKAKSGVVAGGYLVGRHPECDLRIEANTVSNRHCLLFPEKKSGVPIALVEDLSGNGTYVNDAIVGRNKRRELQDRDEISIIDEARFIFRYPHRQTSSGFRQQYMIHEQLGKGHFASVHLCVERSSGSRFAVKIFEKRGGNDRSRTEGLQQEIAVLMSVSHPSLLCLKDTFDEEDGVYVVLELAPEGELFNWIVMKQKLSESEARKVFIQLFQAVKFLHERNIVHRDIKPENILLTDKDLSIKLADFGLAKIIGEESFTTTLCGTPSYVAPEILEPGNHRRYTRAVDVWSLGVVLYICLCGFPPFSDELWSDENPYTLSQQIKMGRFDYPSPYWDPVGDAALDLIDKMLTVNVDERATIDECLEHPWTTLAEINPKDSTDGLTGAIASLDFSKRKPHRERTLLATMNEVRVSRVIDIAPQSQVKVYEKNGSQSRKHNATKSKTGTNGAANREGTPGADRNTEEFAKLGGKGDQALFPDDAGSIYEPDTVVKANLKKGRR